MIPGLTQWDKVPKHTAIVCSWLAAWMQTRDTWQCDLLTPILAAETWVPMAPRMCQLVDCVLLLLCRTAPRDLTSVPAAEGHGLSWRSHNLLHRQDPETGAQLWGVRFDSPAVAVFTANGTAVAVHRAPQATSSLAAPAGRL